MSKVWVGVISGAAGIAIGLWIAKQYARSQTQDLIHEGLGSIGLGGGIVEKIADAVVIPQVG